MKNIFLKIFGVKYKGEIHAVMCFAYTNQIPKNVNELDKFSHDAFLQSAQRDQNVGKIAIAYTVWSKKKGGGKLIVKEVFKKIKKSNQNLKFTIRKNPDILKTISNSKQRPQILIGFSAETENIIENAKSKLISKNLDLIIANDVSENKVFGKDTNKVYVLSADSCDEWCEQSKILVASNLVDKINQMLCKT